MFFDLEFVFEVRNACLTVGVGHRAVYEMADARAFSGIRHIYAAAEFGIGFTLVTLHRIDAPDPVHRTGKRRRIVELAPDHLGPVTHESARLVAVGVAREGAHLQTAVPHMPQSGSALFSGCAGH